MADLPQMERALLNAHKAGDVEAARKLAVAIKAERARMTPKPRLGASGTLLRGGLKGAAGLLELPVQAYAGFSGLVNSGIAAGARALGADRVAGAFEGGAALNTAAAGATPLQGAIDAGFNRFTRPGSRVVETLGSAVLPTAGTVRAGAMLAQSERPGVAAVGRDLAMSPKTQAAAALASGGSLEAARGADLPVPVQVAAAMAGGTAVPVAMAGGQGAMAVRRMASGDAAREGAARLLQEAAIDPRLAAARLDGAGSVVPGVVPTAGEGSLDPGIAGLQRSLMSMGNNQGAVISQRMGTNTGLRAGAVDATFGQGSPQSLVTAADAQMAGLQGQLADAVDSVGPLTAPEVSGAQLRGLLISNEDQARAQASQLYRNVEGLDEPLQVGVFDEASVVPAPEPDAGYAAWRRDMETQLDPEELASTQTPLREGGSFAAWVRSKGGIRPRMTTGDRRFGVGDLYAMGITPRSMPGLFRQTDGMDGKRASYGIDQLTRMAIDEGQLPPGSTPEDFVAALDRSLTGPRPDVQTRTAAAQSVDAFAGELEARGFTPGAMSDEDWFRFYQQETGAPDPQTTAAPNPGQPLSRLQAGLAMIDMDFPGEEIPASLRRLVEPIIKADTMTVGQLAGRVSQLRALSGRLQGLPRAMAAQMADAVDGFVRTKATGGQAVALDRARAAWRNYKATFAENEVGRVLNKQPFSSRDNPSFTMDAGRVPSAVVPAGDTGVGAAERLRAAAGPDAALMAAREQLRRELDGADAATVQRVAARYDATLRAYPELGRDVTRANQAAAAMDAFRRSPMGRLVGDARDPVQVVGQALNARDGGRMMRELADAARSSPEAMAGLRRAIAERVLSGSQRGGQFVATAGEPVQVSNVAALRNAVNGALEQTAKGRVLTNDQRRALAAISRELKRAEFAMKANRAAGSDTTRNTGVALRALRQATQGAGVRQGSMGGMAVEWFMRKLDRTDDILALATEAMVDPKLAAELLRTATPDRVATVRASFGSAATGATVGAAAQGVQQPYSLPSI